MSHFVVGLSPSNPMWVFEENFRLLTAIMPVMENECPLLLESGEQGQSLEVKLLERGRYTDTLLLTRSFASNKELLPDLAMKVRIYYDACLVEVLAYQDCHRIPPRYRVVEGGRFNRDEKRQVNMLLHELLCNCLGRDFRVVRDPDCTRA